jgi:hypothetical protein
LRPICKKHWNQIPPEIRKAITLAKRDSDEWFAAWAAARRAVDPLGDIATTHTSGAPPENVGLPDWYDPNAPIVDDIGKAHEEYQAGQVGLPLADRLGPPRVPRTLRNGGLG